MEEMLGISSVNFLHFDTGTFVYLEPVQLGWIVSFATSLTTAITISFDDHRRRFLPGNDLSSFLFP